MKKAFLRLSLLTLFSIGASFSFGQQVTLDSLINKFDFYRRQSLQEKIYVHLDHTTVLTGEILWFKIYDVDGTFHKPLALSKVAYLEIVDNTNHPVLQTKIELTNGFADGSLYIPATINTGNFTLRAYTNWMRNSDPAFYFHQPVAIINPFKKPERSTYKKTVVYDAQFLPEGGTLLAGEKNKIAFRVTDNQGKGIDFRGAVVNQHKDTITHFKPAKFGLGSFTVTPFLNERYQIVLKDKSGNVSSYNFPQLSELGYQLQVVDSLSDFLSVSINARLYDSEPQFIYLFIHSRNKIALAEMRPLNDGKVIFIISKKILPAGISHITLFDNAQQPVCERLYFKHAPDSLLVSVKSDHEEYGVRRKVTLNIETFDQNKNPVDANLSMRVYKADSLQFFTQRHLSSYLLLTSDLRGEIESPEYYFANTKESREAVDNVMLTHGWRRFNWKSILNKEDINPTFIPEYQSHIIRAKVHDESGMPARGITTYLSSPSKLVRLYGSISDRTGSVQYITKNFSGPRKIILQTNWERDSTYKLKIEDPFSDKFSPIHFPSLQLSSSLEKALLSRSVAMQVQDIYNADKTIQYRKPLNDSTAFFGDADETYFLDDFTRFTVMEEVMREYVRGVWVRKREGKFIFKVLDNTNKGIFEERPLVIIDGVPVFDIDKIMSFDPLKIKKLEVITKKYYLGNSIFPGVVSYSTYTGDLADFQPDPKSVKLDYEGLQVQREFYSPRYNTRQQLESRIPDQRHLLFWGPTITTANGKATIEFYTSDLIGTYKINMEGITRHGLSGKFTGAFSVKRLNY